jgi:hypothetical protein
MVKNVLIGKNRAFGTARTRAGARFVPSRFILHEDRGVMVNRAFPRDRRPMNPILSALS